MRLRFRVARLEERLQSNQAPGPRFSSITVELYNAAGQVETIEEYGPDFSNLKRRYTANEQS